MTTKIFIIALSLTVIGFCGCKPKVVEKPTNVESVELKDSTMFKRYNKYVNISLTADLSQLSPKEKQLLGILLDAAKIIDDIFWEQALGSKDEFIKYLDFIGDENLKNFGLINYGPWDRLDNNNPFINFCGLKPDGANFYPLNMTKTEFESIKDTFKSNAYTLIRRSEDGSLNVVWYHDAYKQKIIKVVELIKKASELAEDAGLKNYLNLRAEALLTDKYFDSDNAWLDMKNNRIDFVAGPIEIYEDALFGYKAAYEAYVLIKDKVWSDKLSRFASFLPELQKSLPVPDKYKKEVPGTNSDLNAYDVVYYAGDCNAGSKTIAINLPNDPIIQTTKGTRRLQLKNAMKAKFDKILLPIANTLIDPSQVKYITFDAFFSNTMFHEVAHGLGIKYTLKGKEVQKVLKETYSTIEEGKADILGLFMITKLHEKGELGETDLMNYYVTFAASIFRSVRFGAASAHGKANMIRFNYFINNEAISRNENGTYTINFEKMKETVIKLSAKILILQGDGDYISAIAWINEDGIIKETLQKDLMKLRNNGIPVDVVFIQGKETLGL